MMSRLSRNNKDVKSTSPNKSTGLNPNAAEFVPSSLITLSGTARNFEPSRTDVHVASGKAVLDRSGSNVSNNSDDDTHQYWCRQLPDDITPDFKVMGENEWKVAGSLSLSGLSIHDGIETSRFAVPAGGNLSGERELLSLHGADDISLSGSMTCSGVDHTGDQSLAPFTNFPSNPWNKNFTSGDQTRRDDYHYIGNSNTCFENNLVNDYDSSSNIPNDHLEILAAQFPGLGAGCLADVYYANGCDLGLTFEFFNQLKLQGDGGLNQSLNSRTLSAPSLAALDSPLSSISNEQKGFLKYSLEDLRRSSTTHQPVDKGSFSFIKYRSSDVPRDALDFASAVRKIASQDSGHWKHERNGSPGMSVGSSRSAHLASLFNRHEKPTFMDKPQSTGKTRAVPVWLETEVALDNIYLQSKEEAPDYVRLRDACFEQAKQAYLLGNKALAKELNARGQFLNVQMKAVHEKKNTHGQRSPVGVETQTSVRGHDPLIDLHGLHVSEAIHVLKHELNILRRTARSGGQRLQVLIHFDTGHHIKGFHAPARLPVAVEQYLLGEGLQYCESQPGLLRVVLQ